MTLDPLLLFVGVVLALGGAFAAGIAIGIEIKGRNWK